MGLIDGLMKIVGRQARKPSGWFGKMLYGHMAAWGHRPLTNWATSFMNIQPSDHVLDVGCGGGMASKLIAQIAVDGFVAGIDHSEDMLQQALKRNAAAIRAGRVEVRHGNVSALPYDDNSFDKVMKRQTGRKWLHIRPVWSSRYTPAPRWWRCSPPPASARRGSRLCQRRAGAGCALWASNRPALNWRR
jgi:SAM-dependent methyltransferase